MPRDAALQPDDIDAAFHAVEHLYRCLDDLRTLRDHDSSLVKLGKLNAWDDYSILAGAMSKLRPDQEERADPLATPAASDVSAALLAQQQTKPLGKIG